MDWNSIFRNRVTTAEDAVKDIQSGDRVWIHPGCNTPTLLIDAMVARAPELENVEVVHILTLAPAPYVAPGYGGPLPTPVPLHRRQRPRRCQRGTGRFRAHPPPRCSRPDLARPDARRRGPDSHLAPRRARFLLLRGRCRRHQDGRRACPHGDRPGQSADAAHPRRLLRPRLQAHPGGRGRSAAHRTPDVGRGIRGGAQDRRAISRR